MNVLDFLGSESQSGNFDIAGFVAQKAEEYGVPPALALAVVNQESGAQSGKLSPKGAIGPMQLMPATARGLGVDPHNDAENIDGGVRYLKQLLDEFGDAKLAAAAYHAGPGAVRKAGGIPDTNDGLIKTSAYADSIMARARKLGLEDGTYSPQSAKKSVLDWLDSGVQQPAAPAQPRTNALNAALDEAAKAVGEPQGFLARQVTSFAKGSGALVKGIGWLVGSDTIQSLGENAEKYWSDIQAKDPETARQLQAVENAHGFMDTLTALKDNPRALADFIVSSVPAMVPGMGGSAVLGEVAGKIAFNSALKAGAARGVAEEAARLAATKFAEKAAVATGTFANMASEGVTQAGMSGAETEKFLLERGMSKQEAAQVARETALKVGAATTMLAGVGAGFETRAALGRLPDKGFVGFAKNVGKEALEEGLQNPAQDFYETKAKQLVDPSQEFDPGKSIAIGVATGGATGGAMHGAGRAGTMLVGEPQTQTPAATAKPTDEENAAAFKASVDEISKAGSVDEAIAAATKAASVPVNIDLGQSVEQMTREQQIRSIVGSDAMRGWLSGLDPAVRQEVLGTANTALSQGASSALRSQSIEQLYQRLNDGGVFAAHEESKIARPVLSEDPGKAAQPTAAEQFLRNREMVTELTQSPEWQALLARVDGATRSSVTETLASINNPRLPAKYRNTLAGTVIDFARQSGVYTGPRQLPAPAMVADTAGNVGTPGAFDLDAEANRRAQITAEREREAMGLTDRGVQAAIQRNAQQPVTQPGQPPQIEMRRAPALPAPDPRIYVDSSGNAGTQASVAQQSADNQRAVVKAMEQRKADGLADRGVQAAIARNEQGRAWREQTAKAYYGTKIHSPKLINEVLRAETPEAAADLVRSMSEAKRGSPKLLDAVHQSLTGQSLEDYQAARASQEIEAAAREAATHPENNLPEPTDSQKEAGNYKKAHINVQGLDITIENPRGSERSGKRPDGSTWSHTMSDHYGYVKRTTGADGEQVDVYVGPNPESKRVFVVDQLNQEDDSFDEHKAMLGFNSREQAVDAYKSNFDPGWKVGPVTEMSMDEFKAWLKGGDTAKPIAAVPTQKSKEEFNAQVQPADDGKPGAESAAEMSSPEQNGRQAAQEPDAQPERRTDTGQPVVSGGDAAVRAGDGAERVSALTEKSTITPEVKTGSPATEAKVEPEAPAPKVEKPKKEIPLSVGRTPNAAEAITVKDGVVYIGKYPAQSFETGEDVTVQEGATPAQIRDALVEAGAVGKGQKVFGASDTGEPATAKFFQQGNFPQPEPFKTKTDANMFRAKNKVDGVPVEKEGGWLFDPAPRALTAEEKAAAAADVKELNKALRAAGVKTVVPLSAIPTANHALAKQLGAVFGAKVQFVSNNPAFEGVAYKGVAYLTENLKRPELAIAGHEVFHTLEQSAPEMAEQLLAHVRGYLQENVVADRKMREELTGGGAVSERYAAGEVLADINGAMWLDPKFWREMRERDVSMFRRVAYLFMEAMTKAVKSLTGTRFDVNALVTDVDAVRSLIAQTWADYNQGRDRSEKAEGAQFSRIPDGIVGAQLGDLAAHKDYAAAKAGDVEAAIRLADDIVTPDLIRRVKAQIGESRPVVLPVLSIEETGRNKIPLAAAASIAKALGLPTETDIVQSTAPKRTQFSGLDRIFKRPEFSGDVAKGESYLLVDDTITQGGTFAALADHIEKNGGTVVGAVALTGKQYSAKISLSDQTLEAIRAKFGDIEQQFQAAAGRGFDALTESEARYLVNFKPTDAVRNRILEEGKQGSDGNSDGKGPQDRDLTDPKFSRLALGELTADQAAAAEHVLGKPKTLKERAQELRQNIGKNLVQGIFDQFAPIRALDKKAYMLSRMSKGGDSTLEAMMIYGKPFVDGDGFYDVDYSQAKGKAGFASIMAPLQGEQDRFFLWVAAQRAERLKAIGLENLFSEKDIQALKTLADGQMEGGKSRKEAYAKALMGMNEFNDAVLKIAVDSGLIDEETRSMYKDTPYVPFYRLQEEGVTGFGMKAGLVNQTAWKKLKGGTEKLNEDLLANTLQNWSHLVTAAAKNRAAKATLEAAVRAGIAEEVPNGTPGKGLVSFRDSGKDRTFLVNDPHVMDAVGALEYAGLGPWAKPLTKMKQMLTMGVTANPAFKIRNLLRDSIQAIGTAELSYNPLENLKSGWLATAEDSETRAKMLASGGMIRFGSMLDGASAERARRMIHKFADGDVLLGDESAVQKFWRKTVEPALDAYQELGDRGEQVNRAALYDQLRAKGMSHGEAAFWARDLMDFSSSGKWQAVRFLTQVVPFMNARLQGLYKLGRAGMEDYKRFATVTGAVALASIALMLAYTDDDDWKKREDWDRQNYWWFKVGDTAFRIPKPFELGAIGTIAEMGVEMFADDEMTGKRFLSNMGDIIGNQLSMNPIPQLVKPMLDVYANKDSFTKRPIENMAMQRLRPEDRYNERTSEVARFLGSLGLPDPVMLMMGSYEALSPVKIDALTKGYFSWLGTMATTALDYGIRPMLDRGERPAMQLKDAFVIGNFAENLPTNSSRYVSQMYEQAKEIEQAYASYHLAVKDGDYSKAREIMESHRDELARYKSIESVKKQESEINARINKIEANQAMPAETKRRLMDMLSRQRDQFARQVSRD